MNGILYNGLFAYDMHKILYKDDEDCIVYAAKQKPGRLSVAVKINESEDTEEASIMRCLEGKSHILPLIDAFVTKKFNVIVTPLMATTLDKTTKLAREMFCKQWMYQLLMAVKECHVMNIIHRDIKPENLFLDKHNDLWLGDFGISTYIQTDGKYDMTANTLWYRPPEVILTDFEYTEKVDIWAAGCVFYEILHRHVLFPEDTEKKLLSAQKKIGSLIGVPSLLRKMLCLDPSKRISATDALSDEYFCTYLHGVSC
jgi:serine/threonine protein kinase